MNVCAKWTIFFVKQGGTAGYYSCPGITQGQDFLYFRGDIYDNSFKTMATEISPSPHLIKKINIKNNL